MTAHVLIYGDVQAVGFRYFVKSNSLKRDLKGWVTNTPDGEVEALLVGDKKEIEEWKKKGPIAHVRQRLETMNAWNEDRVKAIDNKIWEEIDQAVQFAEQSKWEPVEDLKKFLYSAGEP